MSLAGAGLKSLGSILGTALLVVRRLKLPDTRAPLLAVLSARSRLLSWERT